MTDAAQWRAAWRHIRLASDSPQLELGQGVSARIAMTTQVTVLLVTMDPGGVQPGRRHDQEVVVTVIAGETAIDVDGRPAVLVAGDVAVVPGGVSYSLGAGKAGCQRVDVFSPPDLALAEEALHQEHASHGFE